MKFTDTIHAVIMIRTHADDVNGKQIDDKVNKEITFYELRDKFYPVAPTFS